MNIKWDSLTADQEKKVENLFRALDGFDRVTEAMKAVPAPQGRIGFGDLYRFARGEPTGKAASIMQALAENPKLRADFDHLLEQEARYHGPRLAAAATMRASCAT